MAEITLTNVTKRFGAALAVDRLDLQVRDGEFMVILGPSGCGKTTTLRMMSGLETPDEGDVRMDGERVNELPPRERDIAFVFQHYALYPHLTVRRNVGFPLEAQGVAPGEIERRVGEVARMLGITAILGRRPKGLSGADLQRVALGRAVVRQPRAFLMDEPLSNLDAALREHMRVELRRLQTTLGTTAVYVTHDQVEAMAMADRIAVMRDGRLQQVGAPSDLYHRPANLFVAGFIGTPSMNLLEGAELPSGLVRRMAAPADAAGLVVGIRPEDVRIATAPGPDLLAGSIYAVERLGHENIIDVKCGAHVVRVRTAADVAPAVDTSVHLDLCAVRKPCLFDRRTEAAIA